jgi:hypothetical protein
MNEVNKTENNQEIVNKFHVSSNKEGKHFIEDAIFEKLLAIREEIYQQTDINVSPRKLVNSLLQQSDFEALRDKLVAQLFILDNHSANFSYSVPK